MRDSYFNQILILFLKDVKIELRNKLEFGLVTLFSIIAGSVIGYVSRLFLVSDLYVVAGMLALSQFFVSVFAAFKSYIKELERGTIYGLLLSPISPSALFYSKLLLNLLIIETMGFIIIISANIFSSEMILINSRILLGAISIGIYMAAASSFSSAIGLYVESRGLLIPLLIFTLSFPAVLFYVSSIYLNAGLILLAVVGISYGMVMSPLIEFIMSD